MKPEYDFSKAQRGKFYREDAMLRLPVYLDGESLQFVSAIAEKDHKDLSSVVNELIHRNMQKSSKAD